MKTDVRTFSTGVDMRFNGFITYGSISQPMNTISDINENSYGFSLNQFPNFGPLANVYEQVRVDKIKLRIFNTGASGSAQQPLRPVMILYAYDPDGGYEDTRDIFSRSNLQLMTLSPSNPTCTISGVPGAISSTGEVLTKRYFDAQQAGDLKFYLGKLCCACDGFDQNPSSAKLNLICVASITCSFKGRR